MDATPINLEMAVNTPGYMQYPELVWLARQAQKHHKIVEIGALFGKSTRALVDNTPGTVTTYDNFRGPIERPLPPFLAPHVYGLFEWYCADAMMTGKLRVVIADHNNVTYDGQPDMVFLDGSHQFFDVKRDIETWRLKIAPGGLLCGHDIQFPDVKAAVQETLGKFKVAKDTTIWYVNV